MLKKILYYTGLNTEILWSIYNKIWGAFKGPISVYFIINFLLPEEQGLWYTFISLGALKVFAELGFTNIITQFVSHEYPAVKEDGHLIKGEISNLDKFFSLIKYSIRFYSYIIPLAVLIMVIVGFFYFKNDSYSVLLCWFFFSIASGLNLMLSLFQAIYKGMNKVKLVQKNTLLGTVLMSFFNWVCLFLGWSIWALVIGNFVGFCAMLFHLYKLSPVFWKQLFNYKPSKKILWGKQINKLQAKYAISWISGYFIFSLIVPVIYKLSDPVIAGKYGITYSIIITVVGVSQAWIVTKTPKFSILVSQNKKIELERIFRNSFIQSISIQIVLSLLLMILFYILKVYFSSYFDRFLNLEYILYLILIQIPIQAVNFLAIFLRSFKEEPYVIYSVVNALLIVFALYYILPNFEFDYFMKFIVLTYWFILLPYALFVFIRKKKKYSLKMFY